jgi:hypothetical protein
LNSSVLSLKFALLQTRYIALKPNFTAVKWLLCVAVEYLTVKLSLASLYNSSLSFANFRRGNYNYINVLKEPKDETSHVISTVFVGSYCEKFCKF